MKHTDMKQQSIFKDTEPYKLHRKDSPFTSKNAAYSVPSGKMRQLVFIHIEDSGEKGITAKEIMSKHPSIKYSSITSRPTELEKLGLIFYAGAKRDGSRVIRHIKYKSVEE